MGEKSKYNTPSDYFCSVCMHVRTIILQSFLVNNEVAKCVYLVDNITISLSSTYIMINNDIKAFMPCHVTSL